MRLTDERIATMLSVVGDHDAQQAVHELVAEIQARGREHAAEVDALRAENDSLRDDHDAPTMIGLYDAAVARAEAAEKERDEAIERAAAWQRHAENEDSLDARCCTDALARAEAAEARIAAALEFPAQGFPTKDARWCEGFNTARDWFRAALASPGSTE